MSAGTSRLRSFLRREPKQARSRALVDSVLVAFDQLLRTLPDERHVTIERILTRAGVSLGSFYEYFTDKDALLGALVERATRDNFQSLLASYDENPPADITAAIHFVSERVVDTYLVHPARTRIWLAGIGRLQLLGMVVQERDRFARELATRASRLLPDRDEAELAHTMPTVCDAILGIVTGELYRSAPRPRHEVVAAMVAVCTSILGV
ncbi:MAG TPA: TetR/AcrR family transcriptional regulator [Kofleriaceae bacterium]